MDPMELQRMMAAALRSPQDAGANYPDVQPPQRMGPDAGPAVDASMGPVSEVGREPMGLASIQAGLQAMQPQQAMQHQLADPQVRQDRASIDAALQALRASGIPNTSDDAATLVQELYGTRANLR